jgi:hypothetical protein
MKLFLKVDWVALIQIPDYIWIADFLIQFVEEAQERGARIGGLEDARAFSATACLNRLHSLVVTGEYGEGGQDLPVCETSSTQSVADV